MAQKPVKEDECRVIKDDALGECLYGSALKKMMCRVQACLNR